LSVNQRVVTNEARCDARILAGRCASNQPRNLVNGIASTGVAGLAAREPAEYSGFARRELKSVPVG
jgi:hypothetical protein